MRVRWIALGLVAVLAVALLASLVHGRYDTYGPALVGPLAPEAPGWSRPCWRLGKPEGDYTVRCARVKGTVVYAEGRDPDGDGDRHLVVLAGVRLVELKYPDGVGPEDLPGLGATAEATGAQPVGQSGLVPVVIVARPG